MKHSESTDYSKPSRITSDEKLTVCKKTRGFVARAFKTVLAKALASKERVSEIQFRDAWIAEMQKNKRLSKTGWYMPPPKGVCILFGNDKQGEKNRINFKSIRPKEMWPRDDILLERKNGLIFAYASPVDKQTGIIGDFEITLYFGKNEEIQRHLKTCYSVNKEIGDYIQVGMRLKEVYNFANEKVMEKGLRCEHESITDTSASSNMGHTIPASFEPWKLEELQVIQSRNWENAKNIISSKRKFVNSVEKLTIKPGFALTIEPRAFHPSDTSVPQASFHSICLIHKDSSKEIVTNYKELFLLAGMEYMLEAE